MTKPFIFWLLEKRCFVIAILFHVLITIKFINEIEELNMNTLAFNNHVFVFVSGFLLLLFFE